MDRTNANSSHGDREDTQADTSSCGVDDTVPRTRTHARTHVPVEMHKDICTDSAVGSTVMIAGGSITGNYALLAGGGLFLNGGATDVTVPFLSFRSLLVQSIHVRVCRRTQESGDMALAEALKVAAGHSVHG